MLRNNEVVAALGAGVSAHRLLLPIFVGGGLAALLMFGAREWVARTVADRRDAMLDMLTEQRDEQVFEDLWLRDLHGSVVRLGEFRPAASAAVDFEAFLRRPKNEIIIAADRASYADGQWWLEGGEQYVMAETKEVSAREAFDEPDFTPEMALTFRRSQNNPLELSFGEVRELMRRDPDNIVLPHPMAVSLDLPARQPGAAAGGESRSCWAMSAGVAPSAWPWGGSWPCSTSVPTSFSAAWAWGVGSRP